MVLTAAAIMHWASCPDGLAANESARDETPTSQVPRRGAYLRSVNPHNRVPFNISYFVFNDTDRDGVYSLRDSPMAGIPVHLRRPDQNPRVRSSNDGGFANFTVQNKNPRADIHQPGLYNFQPNIPAQWTLTTGNRVQGIRFRSNAKARPGIVADRLPTPVGIARKLSISGRLLLKESAAGSELTDTDYITVAGHSGRLRKVPVNADGHFAIDVGPGDWLLQVPNSAPEAQIGRLISVSRAPVNVGVLNSRHSETCKGDANLHINFESITNTEVRKMPTRYAGLKWEGMIITRKDTYGGDGYINNAVSGNYIAYGSSGYPVTIEHEGGFDFIGGYFGVAWQKGESEALEIKAWSHGALIASDRIQLSALGPIWFAPRYCNITRLRIATEHYWQFVADDLAFRVQYFTKRE